MEKSFMKRNQSRRVDTVALVECDALMEELSGYAKENGNITLEDVDDIIEELYFDVEDDCSGLFYFEK